jgi:hypothetical protein
MVAPEHFDPKILPKGSAKLRWVGQGQGTSFDRFYIFLGVGQEKQCDGETISSKRRVWGNNKLKKTGARSARARTRGKNPLVIYSLLRNAFHGEIIRKEKKSYSA